MVATRRGARVASPEGNFSEESSEVAPPAPGSRRSVMSQSEATARSVRRSGRLLGTRPRSPDDPLSDSDSCCSAAPATPKEDDASECSQSAASTRRAPRSLRRRVQTRAALRDAGAEAEVSEPESCSSVASLSKPSRTPRPRKVLTLSETEPSDPESCCSSLSGLRRSTRIQKMSVTGEDARSSPSTMKLRERKAQTEYREDAGDSEGCCSGPSTSEWRSALPRSYVLLTESDSGGVSPARGRGTPCSSRTGSASSSTRVTRSKARTTDGTLTQAVDGSASVVVHEASEEPLENTIQETSEVHDCTVSEELDGDVMVLTQTEAEEGEMDTTMATDEAQEIDLAEDVELTESPEEMEVNASTSKDTEALEDKAEDVELTGSVEVEENAKDTEALKDKAEDVELTENPEEMEVNASTSKDTEALEDKAEDAELTGSVEVEDNAKHSEALGNSTGEDQAEDLLTGSAGDGGLITEVNTTVTEDLEGPEGVNDDAMEARNTSPNDAEVSTTADPHQSETPREETVSEEDLPTETSQTEDLDEEPAENISEPEGPSSSRFLEDQTSRSPAQKNAASLLDSSEDEEEDDSVSDADLSSSAVRRKHRSEDAEGDLFVIDTRPGLHTDEEHYTGTQKVEGDQEEEEDEDFIDEEGDDDDEDDDSKVLFAPKRPEMLLSTSINPGLKMKTLGGLYVSFEGSKPKTLQAEKKLSHVDQLMKKSVITPGFEKLDAVPPYKESKNSLKLKRRAEREKTAGSGWFQMKAPELTEELKNDLKALHMRSALDPKHFYKKNDRAAPPKFFQLGTVMDSPLEHYSSRVPKKQRKRSMLEELLADAEFRSYNKRKYQEIVGEKAAQAAGRRHHKHTFHKKKARK